MMEGQDQYHGCLVAFEGPAETVSAQLRLLPPSPHILVLPDIQHYLRVTLDDKPISSKTFIKKVRNALKARHEEALDFLRPATAKSKRLVFTHGSTVGALTLCIKQISDFQTQGDFVEGEIVFGELVKDGVAGLVRDNTLYERTNSLRSSHDVKNTSHGMPPIQQGRGEDDSNADQDPFIRAMEAADALDRETASLQPRNYDVDLTRQRLTRRFSLPTFDFDYKYKNTKISSLDCAFADRPSDGEQRITVLTSAFESLPVQRVPLMGTVCKRPLRIEVSGPPFSSGFVGELDVVSMDSTIALPTLFSPRSYDSALPSPLTDTYSSPPLSPAVYGEATLVDVRPEPAQIFLRRVASLDRVFLRKEKVLAPTTSKKTLNKDIFKHRKRPSSCQDASFVLTVLDHKAQYLDVPQTVFVKAHETTISRSPTVLDRSNKYPDKATNKENVRPQPGCSENIFEPVFTLVEDMTIRFSDVERDHLLDLVIEGFKDTTNPSLVPASFNGYDQPPAWMQRGSVEMLKVVGHLPAPAQTPPLRKNNMDCRFAQVATTGDSTPIVTQNTLRTLLGDRFPSGENGFPAPMFSMVPDADSLWRPVLRDAGTNSKAKNGMKIDLILAMGAQSKVRKEYWSAITGQIEKLGTKPSGISRSGRLDLRYLMANAMAAFTTRPTRAHVQEDPLDDSKLMAALITPHLDLYMMTHSDVRFLILEYPADCLSVVVALQELIGSQVFRVAGVLDIDEHMPSPMPRSASRATKHSHANSLGSINHATSMTDRDGPSRSSSELISFAKANFILTSSATDSEIANFISAIWKTLISISTFYRPEHASQKVSFFQSLPQAASAYAKAMAGPERQNHACQNGHVRQKSSLAVVYNANTALEVPLSPSMLPSDSFNHATTNETPGMIAGLSAPPKPIPSYALRSNLGLELRRAASLESTLLPVEPNNTGVTGFPRRVGVNRAKDTGTSSRAIGTRPRARLAVDKEVMMTGAVDVGGLSEDGEFVDKMLYRQQDGGERNGCGEGYSSYDFEERRLISHVRPRQAQKPSSRKALKWLGLAQ